MKTKTKTRGSAVISGSAAALRPPAQVSLSRLTHKKPAGHPVSLDALPKMAERISQLPPTEEEKRNEKEEKQRKEEAKADDRPVEEPRPSLENPAVEPDQMPFDGVYDRPERSFD